jgi:ABC-type lipoprotein release transport system permease subunit
LLYELQGRARAVLVASAVVLRTVAFGAGAIPADRAATIDPMRALRYQ